MIESIVEITPTTKEVLIEYPICDKCNKSGKPSKERIKRFFTKYFNTENMYCFGDWAPDGWTLISTYKNNEVSIHYIWCDCCTKDAKLS
jgi:hypothetical protein